MVEATATIESGGIIGPGSREFKMDYRLPPETVSNQSRISQQEFSRNHSKSAIVKTNDIDHLFTQGLTNMITKTSNEIIINRVSSLPPENKTNIWTKVKIALDLESFETKQAKKRSKAGRRLPKHECGRARDLAAVKAGFKSANSYISAKTVYYNAHQDIKKIVEDDIIKLTPAAKIAKLDMDIQIKTAEILRLIADNFKNHKQAVSLFVNNLLTDPTQNLDRLFNRLTKEIKNGKGCLKQIVNKNTTAKINDGNTRKTDPNPLKKISDVHESLSECLIFKSEITEFDKNTTYDIDKKLSHIEKVSKNLRILLREKSSFFDDSFNDVANYYRSQLREAVQFFAHTLTNNLDKTDEALLTDLHRTFHNSTTILYNVATVTARQIRY